ncbi:hypothetical protein EDC96DRAFT_567560 [Choanephora cucurbitarum]|nr:hypothetical protein EDC96DRAFT_567560 [Choanephora cucurbitarum]
MSSYNLPSLSDVLSPSMMLELSRKKSLRFVLNFTFEQTHFPSLELRLKLGKQLDMTPRAVQIWFQNKRQSIRTREKTINQKSCVVELLPTAAYLYCSPSLQRYMQYSNCNKKKTIKLTSMATSSIKIDFEINTLESSSIIAISKQRRFAVRAKKETLKLAILSGKDYARSLALPDIGIPRILWLNKSLSYSESGQAAYRKTLSTFIKAFFKKPL